MVINQIKQFCIEFVYVKTNLFLHVTQPLYETFPLFSLIVITIKIKFPFSESQQQ